MSNQNCVSLIQRQLIRNTYTYRCVVFLLATILELVMSNISTLGVENTISWYFSVRNELEQSFYAKCRAIYSNGDSQTRSRFSHNPNSPNSSSNPYGRQQFRINPTLTGSSSVSVSPSVANSTFLPSNRIRVSTESCARGSRRTSKQTTWPPYTHRGQ